MELKTLKDIKHYNIRYDNLIDNEELRQLAIERYKHWKIIRGTTINSYTTSCELLGRMTELKELFELREEELK